jgi:hypothetical protein
MHEFRTVGSIAALRIFNNYTVFISVKGHTIDRHPAVLRSTSTCPPSITGDGNVPSALLNLCPRCLSSPILKGLLGFKGHSSPALPSCRRLHGAGVHRLLPLHQVKYCPRGSDAVTARTPLEVRRGLCNAVRVRSRLFCMAFSRESGELG